MAKIYVDTTRFVNFYESADDKIIQIEELQEIKSSLVLTEQTITEFRRKRFRAITKLRNSLEQTIRNDQPPKVAVIARLEEFKELEKLHRAKLKVIADYLAKLITDEQEDPVAKGILALRDDKVVCYLPLSDDAFLRAQKRKLLGNPPRSQNTYTIGDEVIWELLLANLKEDLVVVTGDKTYEENFSLLSEEYHERTGCKLLRATKWLKEGMRAIGKEPTKELIEAEEREKKEQESFADWSSFADSPAYLRRPWLDSFYHRNPLLFPDAVTVLPGGTLLHSGSGRLTDVTNPGPNTKK